MYKEKLKTLVNDMNILLKDYALFPQNYNIHPDEIRHFKLSINSDVKFDNGRFGAVIDLVYIDSGVNFSVLHKTYTSDKEIDINSFCFQVYWEVFRNIFMAKDAVGVMMGEGKPFNQLSFQTLFESGLDKLKQNNNE